MIRTKSQFNALSQAGRLGNFLRTWDTLDDFFRFKLPDWITIRARDKQSPWFVPAIHSWDLGPTIDEMRARGFGGGSDAPMKDTLRCFDQELYCQEIPDPRARRVIQFEAMLGPCVLGQASGLNMVYELNTDKPLRDIRDRGTWVGGLAAQTVLRRHLGGTSLDTLTEIWEEHPSAIIEATEFSRPCGVFDKQLIVWEVRDY